MKASVRNLLVVALLIVFLFSGGMFVYEWMEAKEAKEAYALAEELVALPAPQEVEQEVPVARDYLEELKHLDFTALLEEAPEVVGWILIPETNISYPLMQGKDNSYYLKRNFKQEVNSAGAIFLDAGNATTLDDFNSIIYGHRMKNGTMFEALKGYEHQDFWQNHPDIYLATPHGESIRYTIFAAYEENAQGGESYRLDWGEDTTAKEAFLHGAVAQSRIKTDITPTADDHILTLSTCTGQGYKTRLVVQAIRIDP